MPLAWVRGYDRAWLRADLVAGLVAGAVVIPQAMAYGTIAGLPVEVGLYTCIVPMITYVVLGGAQRLSMSTTSTIVALTGAALAGAGIQGSPDELLEAATTLTFLVGAVLLLARVLRLAFIVDAIGQPVLIGVPDEGDGFFSDVASIFRHLDDTNRATVLLSAATIATILGLKRFAPKVPGVLVAIVGGILAVGVFGIDEEGVAVIPDVPRGLPAPTIPAFESVEALMPYAIAIALLAFMESVAIARTTREFDDPPLDNDQELVAVGAASVLGSFFQSAPAAGGFSQTLVNAGAGARTQMSELVTAGLAIVTAVALAPLFSDLPAATLSSVVFIAVLGLIKPSEVARLWRIDRPEVLVVALTGGAALVFGLLTGVVVGVVSTFWLAIRALNHPVLMELRRPPGGGALGAARPGDEPVPGLLALRVEGGLYTMNIRAVQEAILARVDGTHPAPDVVLVDAGGTADTTVMVMDAFAETAQRLDRRGIELWVAALPVRAAEKAERTPAYAQLVDSGRVHRTVVDAVAAFEARQA